MQKDLAKMTAHFLTGVELERAKKERRIREAEENKVNSILREKNIKILNEARSQVLHLQTELRELTDKSETFQAVISNKRAKEILTSLAQLRMYIEHFKLL